MKNRIISWIILLISLFGIYFSIRLMIIGRQPCSSDSCIIQLLFVLGIIIFIPSIIIALFIVIKSIKSIKLKSTNEN